MSTPQKYFFLGIHVFICDFHREQAWDRWFTKKDHGCSGRKGDIIPKLRRIARSKTVEDMKDAIDSFKSSEFWSPDDYPKLIEYLNKYWFPIIKVTNILDELYCIGFVMLLWARRVKQK